MNTTIIKKNYKHDSMTLLAKFPSGASLKFSVNRNGEDLALAFSNDREVLKQQSKEVNNWLKLKGSETNQERFNRLEQLCLKVKSGADFIHKITTKQLIEQLEKASGKKVLLKEGSTEFAAQNNLLRQLAKLEQVIKSSGENEWYYISLTVDGQLVIDEAEHGILCDARVDPENQILHININLQDSIFG